MEQRENYSSLHEFTEEPRPGANRLIPQHSDGSQGLKQGVKCLRSKTSLLILIGFLASICGYIVLAVLLISRPVPPGPLESSSSSALGLKSMERRYIQLCEDYTALGQGCSKTVKQCRASHRESVLLFQQWQAGLGEEQRQLWRNWQPSHHTAHHRTAYTGIKRAQSQITTTQEGNTERTVPP